MNNDQNNSSNQDFDFERAQSSRQGAQNPYASSYRDDSSVRRGYSAQNSRRKVRKQRSQFKFNWGAVIFLVVVAIVIVVSVIQISKNPTKPNVNENADPPISDVTESENNDPSVDPGEADSRHEDEIGSVTGEETPDEQDEVGYKTFTVAISNGAEDCGDLILVNYDYDFSEYADFIPVINTYEKRTTHFKVAGTNIELSPLAFEAFEEMVKGLEDATGCDDLIINSGYRSMTDQQEIYDYYLSSKGEDYVRDYVADPGKSEHHTGYALDLSFYLDNGSSENVGIHEHGSWLTEHCSDYGFVVRYPEDKVEYTHIAYEPWHFRYVGVVHAKAMSSLGMCLEEYIELLDGCTLGEKVLYLSDDGSASLMYTDSLPTDSGYAIYSVHVSGGDKTELTIYGDDGADYIWSGTNTGMFVVTVPLG